MREIEGRREKHAIKTIQAGRQELKRIIAGMLRRYHPEVGLFGLSKYFRKNLLAFKRERRKLLIVDDKMVFRSLDAPQAFLVPYLLEALREVHEAEQEPAVRLVGIVRREPRIEETRLRLHLGLVSQAARHLLHLAVARRRVRQVVAAGRSMRKVDEADLQLAALAAPAAARRHGPDEQVLARSAPETWPRVPRVPGSAVQLAALEGLATLAACRGALHAGSAEGLLGVAVAVIDQEQAAAVEPEPLEALDDAGQSIQLSEDDGDLIHEETLAIVQERREYRGEVFGADFATLVFVLSDVGLGGMVPHLMETRLSAQNLSNVKRNTAKRRVKRETKSLWVCMTGVRI